MDVSMTAQLSIKSAQYAQTSAANTKGTAATDNAPQTGVTATGSDFELSAAYDVSISDAAKTASKATKGLTDDQIQVLQDGITKSQQLMIKTLTEQNLKLQGWLDDGIGTLNFDGVLVGADKFALPAVATTPEEAQKAISDGGDWSVDAVAGRIMDMASTIAGGDVTKLQQMQDAVEKGFKQAGIAFKDATGEDKMPDITQKTHDEVTKRFNALYDQLNKKTDDTQSAQNTKDAQSKEDQTATKTQL